MSSPAASPKTPMAMTNPDLPYHVVATDMDGTICEHSFIHETTHETIEKLKNHNVLIIPATGRGPQLAASILKLVNLPSIPAAYHHGALTFDQHGERILNLTVPWSVFDCMIEGVKRMITERGVYASVIAQCADIKFPIFEDASLGRSLTNDRWDMGYVVDGVPMGSCGNPQAERKGHTVTVNDMTAEHRDNVYQATLLNANEEPPETIQWQREVLAQVFAEHGIEHVKSHASGRYYIDVIHIDADKKFALKALSTSMGFSLERVLALGDNQNDLGMLEVAGKSVAMGNGRAEVKEAADFVTATVKDGGWAKAVDAFLFC